MKTLLHPSQFVIILIFTAASCLSAQTGVSLRSGEQLSRLSRYGQSTEQLEAFIRENPNRFYDLSEAWLVISYNRLQLGDFRGALEANEHSLEIKAQLQADDLVQNYIRFGEIYLRRGHYKAALDNLLKAQELPIESIQLFAEIEQLLASVYRGLRQYDQAEGYYRQATETLLIEYPDQHPEVIGSFNQLGELYLEWGRPQEARRYFEQGLERGVSLTEQRFLAGRLYDGLGRTYEQLDNDLAEQHYRKALQIFLQTFGANHRETAQTHLRLARWYEDNQRMDESRTAVLQALKSLLPDATSLNWEDLPTDLSIVIDRPLLIEALGLRSRLLLASGVDTDRRLALDNAELAAELADETLYWFADHAERFEILATVKHALAPGIRAGIELADPVSLEKAFLLADRWKLLDIRLEMPRPSVSLNEYSRLIYELRQALALAEVGLRRQPNDLNARQEVKRQWENYQYGRNRWQKTDPYSYQWEYGPTKKQVSEIRGQLNEQAAIISYWFDEDHAYVFALSRQDLIAKELLPPADSGSDDLMTIVRQYQTAILEGDGPVYARLGAGMYRQFVSPLKKWLDDKKALVILPDGPLRGLLFETWLTEEVKAGKAVRYHKLPYLLRDYAITYHFSAQMISSVSVTHTRKELALFAPGLEKTATQADEDPASVITYFPSISNFEQIAQAFERKGGHVQRWQEDRATSEALIDIFRSVPYVHLATTGISDTSIPEQSALLTTSGDTEKVGVLSLHALMSKGPYQTQLLTFPFPIRGSKTTADQLPARSIAVGTWMTGIPAAIYPVGVGLIDGDPSLDIFPAFYQELADGASVQQSWNDTRRELIDRKTTADPRHWARWMMVSWP